MNTKKFSAAMSELGDRYVEEAISYEVSRWPNRGRSPRGTVVLAAALIALSALCGFAAYDLGLFDPWLQKPSADPVQTVQNAIERQIDKDYTISVRVDEVKIDDAETARVRAMYSGSELAEARGWSEEYLARHFVVVRARYHVEYDHTKTFMDDGHTEQYFYLTQDTGTGVWTIVDNTSPNTSAAPPAPDATWGYQPLLSAQVPAFPLQFHLSPPLTVEAECDNGTLVDYDGYDGTAYPQGKTLTISGGGALYWAPQTEGEIALSAEIAFTVYSGEETLYAGAISIYGEKVEGGPAQAVYSAVLREGSGLLMEQAPEADGKGMGGAVITAAR